MDFWAVTLAGGVSYGLLLFMLSAGLALVYGLQGVLNFAHAALYMLGAYVAQALAQRVGFWWALGLAPLLVGTLAAGFEWAVLRRIRAKNAGASHLPELLATFGLAYVVQEAVQLVWGRGTLDFQPPPGLQGAALVLLRDASGALHWVWGDAPAALCAAAAACTPLPATRAFIAALALLMLALLALLARTRAGLLLLAARTQPQMVQALGHRLPLLHTLVFGAGAALAALAGVAGGCTFATEPQMAADVGGLAFVVVALGGARSVVGTLAASLLIGVLQTAAVAAPAAVPGAQFAPLLPYALLAAVLLARPQALAGRR